MDQIFVARLSTSAILPTRKHPADAGIDFYANESVEVEAFGFAIIKTGVTVTIPIGFVGLLMNKSRNNFLLGGGVVDAGYQGEILIKVFNPLPHTLRIEWGQAIGQMLIIPVALPMVCELSAERIHVDASERGKTGGIAAQAQGNVN